MRRVEDPGAGFGMATVGLKLIGKKAQERSLERNLLNQGTLATEGAVQSSIL